MQRENFNKTCTSLMLVWFCHHKYQLHAWVVGFVPLPVGRNVGGSELEEETIMASIVLPIVLVEGVVQLMLFFSFDEVLVWLLDSKCIGRDIKEYSILSTCQLRRKISKYKLVGTENEIEGGSYTIRGRSPCSLDLADIYRYLQRVVNYPKAALSPFYTSSAWWNL